MKSETSETKTGGGLTGQVWPRSRLLFSIVSKMSKDGVLAELQGRD